ncbi:purine catabolism regulator [Microbacterium endophyticum]|uniref:Purine catabolism regulator n=1 Tax=Microbacterium endophyticum TaxID=1526412 RepID=A0A7W4V4C7_9MICO|nr:PucR family transcriptional regulator [Microbacterium endophyticum]MBB2976633.1 purine catabolism regulator [Microbacterium endophyticum]NIK37484.1 purine catabolism regulator [Microbacterium endophyticum]
MGGTGDSTADRPTLSALLGRTDLGLRLASSPESLPPGALEQDVRWVHSSDLADPTPFLSDGLALLTTGTQFTDESPASFDDYVARLKRRGVVALGFGTEVVREGIPEPLRAACQAHSIPLFEVPYVTPFIAIARANAEAIAALSYARRSWALSAQRAISLAALRPNALGATLTELSRQLGAWVGLFDASGSLTRQHPEAGLSESTMGALSDEVRGVLRRNARAGSSFRIEQTSFSLQTLGRGGRLRGVIAIGGGELDQESRGLVTSVVAMAGLALEQQQNLQRARTQLRAGVLQALRAQNPTLAAKLAREVFGPLPAPPLTIGVTSAGSTAIAPLAEWLELRAEEQQGALFFGRCDDALVLLLGAGGNGAVFADMTELFDVRLGVAEHAHWDDFSTGYEQALLARKRGRDSVSVFSEVSRAGIRAVLDTADARTFARASLAPLRALDERERSELENSLRVWLANNCSYETTARVLRVHRHTVRARIAQAEKVLKRDLSHFGTRAELWAAFEATSDELA